jgi:hypothetical protein
MKQGCCPLFCASAGARTRTRHRARHERQVNIMPGTLGWCHSAWMSPPIRGRRTCNWVSPAGRRDAQPLFHARDGCSVVTRQVRQVWSQRILGSSRQKLYDRRTTSCPLDPRNRDGWDLASVGMGAAGQGSRGWGWRCCIPYACRGRTTYI